MHNRKQKLSSDNTTTSFQSNINNLRAKLWF